MKTPNYPLQTMKLFKLTLMTGAFLALIHTPVQAATIALNVDAETALGFAPTQVYYAMDSIVSATTPDSSGNGLTGNLDDGTDNVAPTLLVPGKFGNAIQVKGTTNINDVNPWLYRSTTTPLQLGGMSFTMGMWMNLDSIRSGESYLQYVMGAGAGGVATDPGYTFYLGKSSVAENWNLNFEARNGTSASTVATPNKAFAFGLGEWHHFGMSFDDATNEVRFYVDGNYEGGGTTSVEIGNNGASSLEWDLGERGTSTWNGYFDGAYDDAFITSGVYDFTVVPEPASAVLLILGLAGCILSRRKTA